MFFLLPEICFRKPYNFAKFEVRQENAIAQYARTKKNDQFINLTLSPGPSRVYKVGSWVPKVGRLDKSTRAAETKVKTLKVMRDKER